MKYNVSTIEQYLEVIPANRKEILKRLINLVNEYFPDIKGDMEYNMPTFNPVCALASQKHYVSVYIHRLDLVEKYRNELGKLKVGKSCIRFRKLE
ncbi:MAG: DUF1801 domain-containing protein [Mariniphaga sp.]|nr:DUF1801 domain-containing protein [Mariniphaga sp.]